MIMKAAISSIFVKSPVFGTVVSSSMIVDPTQSKVSVLEFGFGINGVEQYVHEFQHKMSK